MAQISPNPVQKTSIRTAKKETKVIRNTYQTEAERHFYITTKDFFALLQPKKEGVGGIGQLTHIRTLKIRQRWLTNGLTESGFAYRTRIRETQEIVPVKSEKTYEYTTKFDTQTNAVVELNVPITALEHAILCKIYPETVQVCKTRFICADNDNGTIYSFDLYDDGDKIRVEVEYDNIQKLKEYETPEWLSAIAVKGE